MNVLKCLIGVAVLLVAVAFVMPCEAQVVVRQPFFRPNAVVIRNAQPQRIVAQRPIVAHQQQLLLQQHFVQPQALVIPQSQQFFLQQPQAIVIPNGGCNGNCRGQPLILR